MRISVVILIMSFLAVPLASAQQPSHQEDASLRAAIARDPRAEKPRFEYAYYLYSKKRFKEAREQLGFLFGLNTSHNMGRKLNNHMNEIEGLNDTEYQDSQMEVFALEKAKYDQENASEDAKQTLTPDRISRIKSELDKRYGLSHRLKTENKLEPGEEKFQNDFHAFKSVGNFDKAERVARSWISQFAKSPIAKADFVAFLISRGRFPQAEAIMSNAAKEHPECLKLKIVSDLLKEIKTVKSSEKITELKSKLSDDLAVYQLALTGRIQDALRMPANTRSGY